jgi:hypothetical protein
MSQHCANHAQTMRKPCSNHAQTLRKPCATMLNMRDPAQTLDHFICVETEVYFLERLVGKAVEAPSAAGAGLALPVVVLCCKAG